MYILTLVVACLATVDANPSLLSGRILGGQNVSIQERPFQISVEVSGTHICGGSILSNYYIVTAGHCISPNATVKDYKIRVGTDQKQRDGWLHEVEFAKRHENYSTTPVANSSIIQKLQVHNDIGLIRVKNAFTFNEKVQPIKLVALGEKVKAGAISVTSGWGMTEKWTLEDTVHLKAVAMPAYDQPLCNNIYKETSSILPGGVPEGFVCAGIFGVVNKSGCYGDSGGPMTIDGYLAGIVSYGRLCGSPKYPTVFTDIAYFHDWIQKNIQN